MLLPYQANYVILDTTSQDLQETPLIYYQEALEIKPLMIELNAGTWSHPLVSNQAYFLMIDMPDGETYRTQLHWVDRLRGVLKYQFVSTDFKECGTAVAWVEIEDLNNTVDNTLTQKFSFRIRKTIKPANSFSSTNMMEWAAEVDSVLADYDSRIKQLEQKQQP